MLQSIKLNAAQVNFYISLQYKHENRRVPAAVGILLFFSTYQKHPYKLKTKYHGSKLHDRRGIQKTTRFTKSIRKR